MARGRQRKNQTKVTLERRWLNMNDEELREAIIADASPCYPADQPPKPIQLDAAMGLVKQRNTSPNGAETAKRRCKENSSFDAQQHETSSQSPRAQKKATSSNAPSVATGANGEPQGKDLHSIASRITSPEIHLTSRISQRHDDLSNGAREYHL
ncbi:hypothetical protein H4Q26_012117, partial [Puccinia striiformis f. sp. tritici PST-130]